MSNKTIIIAIFLLAFLVPVANATAQTASDSPKLNFREKLQDRKEKIVENRKEFIAGIQEKRTEFREKLQQIKDTRKKVLAERVDLKLSEVNTNSTNRMLSSLDKLETLLDKFSTRAATLKSDGKDTTEVDAAVIAAEDAIDDAKDAVADQAEKDYTADLSDETALKENFGQIMSALRKDLKTTHDSVKMAKQKVMDVARALAKLKTPTPTI